MIAYIKGRIIDKHEQKLIIETGGLGYEVLLDARTFETVPGKGHELELFIYQQIREDAQVLFGFNSLLDRKIFLLLTSVSGIGPKSALSFLSGFNAKDIINAIHRGDAAQISTTPGIGKKTAEKVVVELKDKMIKLFPSEISAESHSVMAKKPNVSGLESGFDEELRSVMKALGYNPREIDQAMQKNIEKIGQTESVEAAIKILLKNI